MRDVTKRLLELGFLHGDLIQVEPLVQRVIDQATTLIARRGVDRWQLVQQLNRRLERRRPHLEPTPSVNLLRRDPRPVGAEYVEPLLDLAGWQSLLGQIDESFFAHVEILELRVERLFHLRQALFLVGNHRVDLAGDHVDNRPRQFKRLVVPRHEVLDQWHGEVWQVTDPAEPVGTDEVGVGASSGLGFGVDQLPDLPSAAAAIAVQLLLEVVEVGTVPPRRSRAFGEHRLHSLEQFMADQRLVPALKKLAFVAHHADVVGVVQDAMPLGRCWGLRRRCRSCRFQPEAEIGHPFGEALDRVVAGRIQLEGSPNQRAAFRVDDDRADLATFEVLLDVDVAERRLADGAATLRFVCHLAGDVLAFGGRSVAVDAGRDAVHQFTHRAVVDVLGGGDELDPDTAHVHDGHGIIDAVPVESGQLVDHDVVRIAAFLETLQHRQVLGPTVGIGTAAAEFNVLVDDLEAELVRSTGADLALGGDRNALRVIVGLDLRLSGDAEVQDDATNLADDSGRQF